MSNNLRGIIAGLIATVVLSILMFVKSMMGVMPDLNVIEMLASQMGGSIVIGWAAHFIIGAIFYGLAFANLGSMIPGGSAIGRGIVLGVIGWLMMMVALMPMVGAGFFALNMGIMAAVATLVLHAIFGFALGLTYKKLGS
ncbi:hypothetical protein MARI_05580 [Marinobacter sp. JH2]|uniref:DUF6789 family protein n=1 Tax=Marinobacter sp. AL4B TaxID=2871173 RepID=UPI0010543500|nr:MULTISPECIES: DUF6789 family protein [unclassified Marinobacter]MBZ0333302.1 hypothetical protein [Marinobacter sp. AL4B]QBM16477.1 hypothetical protein MARI_05580 [Marinobacter sp. JH2]